MLDDIVTVRLSRSQAEFLQANLSLLATTTRQAMGRPGLDPERHMALGSRAIALERTEDAVRIALMDVPNNVRKSTRGEAVVAHPRSQRHAQEADRSFAD